MENRENRIQAQVERFKKGFPFIKVISPAVIGKGILRLDESERTACINRYDAFEGSAMKFVPASGAATRMFRDLFHSLEELEKGEEPKSDSPGMKFVANIQNFPFYDADQLQGKDIPSLLRWVLFEENGGLGYASRPKGLLLFHSYLDMFQNQKMEARTAFEEHLVEGARYLKDMVKIHFTVSPEHRSGFCELLGRVQQRYEEAYGCTYDISFSVQSPDTDIIAVHEDNTPFIREDGSYLFRPGGHGALIQNLNALEADIIFIKNIDNVVHEDRLEDTVVWKKTLAGKLLELRDQAFSYVRALDESAEDDYALCEVIASFLRENFSVVLPDLPQKQIRKSLREKLDRPMRVCGMVRNEGEPGGGPFIVRDADGATSLQILEGAQLDKSASGYAELLAGSTHFNPVDLVCSVRNAKGQKYDLERYVDQEAGFISHKSYKGHDIKAQELPGLWNGAMSDWNTAFVEVPVSTFNPVKTVLDLLRPAHNYGK